MNRRQLLKSAVVGGVASQIPFGFAFAIAPQRLLPLPTKAEQSILKDCINEIRTYLSGVLYVYKRPIKIGSKIHYRSAIRNRYNSDQYMIHTKTITDIYQPILETYFNITKQYHDDIDRLGVCVSIHYTKLTQNTLHEQMEEFASHLNHQLKSRKSYSLPYMGIYADYLADVVGKSQLGFYGMVEVRDAVSKERYLKEITGDHAEIRRLAKEQAKNDASVENNNQ